MDDSSLAIIDYDEGGKSMCTAITYQTKDFYFGRTLDNECSYGEKITIMPRNYPFSFREVGKIDNHYAIIGMAAIKQNYPLFYDAINEKGLCMAGLNFVGNAVYYKKQTDKKNIAQFEFIPWILCQCQSVAEVKTLLQTTQLIDTPFHEQLPIAQLHWIIADQQACITIEAMQDGMKIYDNPVGVLTNNPPFDMQMTFLNQYMHLSPSAPKNHFSKKLALKPFSLGMGAFGLPGDLSSTSRFVRVSFMKMNATSKIPEADSVNQFFHILNCVDQPRGCNRLADGKDEMTLYTSCCNATKGIYYYTTYQNHQIHAVCLFHENLDQQELISYDLCMKEQINYQN